MKRNHVPILGLGVFMLGFGAATDVRSDVAPSAGLAESCTDLHRIIAAQAEHILQLEAELLACRSHPGAPPPRCSSACAGDRRVSGR